MLRAALMAATCAFTLGLAMTQSNAIGLGVDTGWQYDEAAGLDDTTTNSPVILHILGAVYSLEISLTNDAGGFTDNGVNAAGPDSLAGVGYQLDIAPSGQYLFSLSDGFIPGDLYTVNWTGTTSGSATSVFPLFPTPFLNPVGPDEGYFAGPWLDTTYSHLQLDFGPASTPLPAALPLFASGLGAMGLLGWRRKRKNATVAPA